MEQVDRRIVLRAKAATFTEQQEDRGYARGVGRGQGGCCRGIEQKR